MQAKMWKQLDVDYSPSVVVDSDNHYVSTACSETAAKLFIKEHNDLVMAYSVRKVFNEQTKKQKR